LGLTVSAGKAENRGSPLPPGVDSADNRTISEYAARPRRPIKASIGKQFANNECFCLLGIEFFRNRR
jgi:hypothetical protein